MKLQFCLLMALLLSACSTAPIPAPTTPPSVNWAEDVDFSAVRHTIGWAPDFRQKCIEQRPLVEVYDAVAAQNWQVAANKGVKWLQQCPIDIRMHYLTSIALEKLGDQNGSDDHYRWFNGLMESLVSSGDGDSPQTAYVTVSVQEEYDAMYFFQVRPTSQRLVSNPLCDEIHVTDSEGNKAVIYFNAAAHFDRLLKQRATK